MRTRSPSPTHSFALFIHSFRAFVISFAKRFLLLLLNVKKWFDLQLNVKHADPNEIKQFSSQFMDRHMENFAACKSAEWRVSGKGRECVCLPLHFVFLFVEVKKKKRIQAQHLYLVNICLIIMECWKLITRRFSAVNMRVCVHIAYLSLIHWEKLCARLQKKNTQSRVSSSSLAAVFERKKTKN